MSYVPAGSGEAYWFFGDRFNYLLTGQQSEGRLFILKADVSPGNGPLPHLHHHEDETFYVISGELLFQVGDESIAAGPGDFVHVPRKVVHSFKNGPAAAQLLITFTPAGVETFFATAGTPAGPDTSAPPLNHEMIAQAQALEGQYGVETILPPESGGS
ncbi:MAG: quercetin 2,3-dioxygenase [Anaerolineales bacterium]|nr:quercetin 2,3-dioxygenase [Anaerolineales bacterium]MCB0030385.1 quercetin 2,3-dioxygenase [Anaerolineales bacterium]MCB8963353.1 quercetin 2,3-dioxygenase [Ardenticatenales bacterium]